MNNQPRTPKRCSSAAQPFAVGATLLTRRRSLARVTEMSAAHAKSAATSARAPLL